MAFLKETESKFKRHLSTIHYLLHVVSCAISLLVSSNQSPSTSQSFVLVVPVLVIP